MAEQEEALKIIETFSTERLDSRFPFPYYFRRLDRNVIVSCSGFSLSFLEENSAGWLGELILKVRPPALGLTSPKVKNYVLVGLTAVYILRGRAQRISTMESDGSEKLAIRLLFSSWHGRRYTTNDHLRQLISEENALAEEATND